MIDVGMMIKRVEGIATRLGNETAKSRAFIYTEGADWNSSGHQVTSFERRIACRITRSRGSWILYRCWLARLNSTFDRIAMATVGAVTRQIAALEISAKQNGATTKQTRSLHHQKSASQSSQTQSNVSKLLTKFAAPNPFPDPKPKAKVATTVKAVPPRPANPAHSAAAKQPASSQAKPRELDIGKYDGGFEIENEKRGEAVDGEAARDLALDSSVSRSVLVPAILAPTAHLFLRPLQNTPHARMAPHQL